MQPYNEEDGNEEGLPDGDERMEILEQQRQQPTNRPRITTRYMTKYERARILGTRALQIRYSFSAQSPPQKRLQLQQGIESCAGAVLLPLPCRLLGRRDAQKAAARLFEQKSVKILQDLSLYADRQGSCSVMASQQLQWVCLSHMLECCHTLNHASKGVV